MVIAFCRGSFNRPHRHRNKTESFHVIEGKLMVVFFDDCGRIVRGIRMGPYGGDQTFLYRLSSSVWHTVVPLTEFVIIHETTTGPFLKEETEYPAWGPGETDGEEIKAFMAKITAFINQDVSLSR
jgi:cupin fold WbuC family metalloprotein